MGEKRFMKGNEAIAEAAVRGGCRFFAGYPITPQNEIPEYLSWRLPEVGGDFVQGESEIASINMVYGAAAMGTRAMTSSSSPGISLKTEGISYLAAAMLPALIINVSRGGPGLGSIQPAQSDYLQATKALGHGGFHTLVFAPNTVQEAVDIVYESWEYAERDRNPVFVLLDGCLGNIMEEVDLPEMKEIKPEDVPEWSLSRRNGRDWQGNSGKRKVDGLKNSCLTTRNMLLLHTACLQELQRKQLSSFVKRVTSLVLSDPSPFIRSRKKA